MRSCFSGSRPESRAGLALEIRGVRPVLVTIPLGMLAACV